MITYETIDKDTVKEIKTEERVIDVNALKKEIKDLQDVLLEPKPKDTELIAWAKENHPFYQRMSSIQIEIDKLNDLLNELNG